MKTKRLLAVAVSLMFAGVNVAHADDSASALKAQVEALQKQLDSLKAQLDRVDSQVQVQKQEQEKQASTAPFVQMKPGLATTFVTAGGGEVTIYGNLDVSIDTTTKGLQSNYEQGGMPVGRVGWMPAISTNLSYLGVRGTHPIADQFNFVWQLEGQIDISAEPGTVNTNSNNSSQVKGGLTFRNTYIGLAGNEWGAVKIGKTDAPYKNSTARMNPFSGMLGDYQVIMGNTGGDNRVEFGTRIDHALWYESPTWSGFSFAALVSPGQNRSFDNSNISAGETDCAGGNVPGSGALPPSCNDGSFGNAFSASASFTHDAFYVTAAFEQHNNVNRTSDTIGFPTTPPEDTQGDPNDIGNENAWKIGAQYTFVTKTTVGAIYEKLHRSIPSYLDYQNERSRSGTWLVLTQALTEKDVVSAGWAHANSTPGDPGTHNTPGGANPDNSANMYTVAWKHAFDPSTTIYADWAMTANHADAHYDLGAGGRAVTTDCHDASQLAAFDPTANGGAGGVTGNGPHCFAGGKLQGVSVGLNYKF
jgi:predicted porin